MVSEVFDGRGQDGGSPAPRILFPLAQVEEGSSMVVARSVGEYAPNPDVPQGFSLHPDFSHLKVLLNEDGNPHVLVQPDGEMIHLANRDYDDTDLSLNKFLSGSLTAKLNSGTDPISVLDVGGGYKSSTAIEIGASNERFRVTNVDILLKNATPVSGKAPRNVTPVLGDARNLHVPDNSQDVVFSSRLLIYMNEEDFIAAFKEIVRVLKPGGEAILFDLPMEAGRSTRLTQRLSRELNVDVPDWEIESFIGIGYVVLVSKPEKLEKSVAAEV